MCDDHDDDDDDGDGGPAQGLTRGQQQDSFFTKMSPVCELSLGDQGPFSTTVKPNTTQPSWDESLEFEAFPSPPTLSKVRGVFGEEHFLPSLILLELSPPRFYGKTTWN